MVHISKQARGLVLVLLALVVMSGVACSKDAGPAHTPKDFTEDYPEKARDSLPMTELLRAAVYALNKGDSSLIPDIELVLNKYDDPAERLKDLAKLNAQGLLIFKDIKEKCTISPGQESETGKIEVGQTYTLTLTDTVNGAQCPISHVGTNTSTIIATKFDPDPKSFVLSAAVSSNANSDSQILDGSLRELVNVTRLQTTLNLSGNVDNLDMKGNGSVYVKGSGNVQVTRHTGASPGTIALESIKTAVLEGGQVFITITLPEGKFVLGASLRNNVFKIVINGKEYTPEQATELFGIELNDLIKVSSASRKGRAEILMDVRRSL